MWAIGTINTVHTAVSACVRTSQPQKQIRVWNSSQCDYRLIDGGKHAGVVRTSYSWITAQQNKPILSWYIHVQCSKILLNKQKHHHSSNLSVMRSVYMSPTWECGAYEQCGSIITKPASTSSSTTAVLVVVSCARTHKNVARKESFWLTLGTLPKHVVTLPRV